MQDLTALHKRFCPDKVLGNFWRSQDYKAAAQTLAHLPAVQVVLRNKPAKGHPSRTLVHPLVALAFLRWTDPGEFYSRLNRVVNSE